MQNLKQSPNHGLILKKMHRVIKFNQEARVKPYIDMNTKLRKNAKNDFERNFFKLMSNANFGKTTKNARKVTDIKVVTTKARKNCLFPNLLKIEMTKLLAIKIKKKTQIFMNKPVYLFRSINI